MNDETKPLAETQKLRNENTLTPETDAHYLEQHSGMEDINFARSLERRLSAARDEAQLQRSYAITARHSLGEAQKERDEAWREVERLKARLKINTEQDIWLRIWEAYTASSNVRRLRYGRISA